MSIPPLIRRLAVTAACTAVSAPLLPSRLAAQTVSDVGAWDGLMLSPVGALPPHVREIVGGDSARNEVSVRYGRWRYDSNDAIHNNSGVTFSRTLGPGSTEVAITGAYLSLSCRACKSWLSGGLDVNSTLWRGPVPGVPDWVASGSLGVRAGLGGARYLGDGHATAGSAAASLVAGISRPWIYASHVSLSVLPGYGFGRIASADVTTQGTRPNVGGTLAWTFASGLGIDLGMQRVFIAGGPVQAGMGLSWGNR